MSDPIIPDLRHETPTAPPGLKRGAWVAGGVALVIVAAGLVARHQGEVTAQDTTNVQAVPSVHLTTPSVAGKTDELVLPGTTQAWVSARIYPRVAGYVHGWYRDIGAVVGAGTVLGAIDTPELDQQIIQARATLRRVKAEAALARTTATRWDDLLKTNAVSHQEADEKDAGAVTGEAAVGEAQAALGRLLADKAYATVRAPFAGIVTARNADIGDLVGPGATNPQPMFAMADEHRIRIYVNVPQQYSGQIKAGLPATLSVPEAPGQAIPATVLAQAQAITSASGTLQVQLTTANPGLMLKPGGYAQVHFKLPVPAGQMTIPASALVLRGGGTRVAVVTPQGRIHLIDVTVLHDLGTSVVVAAGVTAGTKIVDNPPDSIVEGMQVRVQGGQNG